MIAYHVVTDRPMTVGQKILFDENHHSGVYQRVQDKLEAVHQIYADPDAYCAETLEHHTAVALRELAMEEIRLKKYPHYPSRMSCLYVSETLEEAQKWAAFFAKSGRPTYAIVKLRIDGHCFAGDASRCFRGTPDKQLNLHLAEQYWNPQAAPQQSNPVTEWLAEGQITVLEIIQEINANL